MSKLILTFTLCATVLASSSLSSPVSTKAVLSAKHKDGGNQVSSFIQLRHLSSVHTMDYFADLIRSTLNWTVKELLVNIDGTFKALDSITKQGIDEILLVEQANPSIAQSLQSIRYNIASQAFQSIADFLKDLSNVLPALQSRITTHDSASDIIYALLQKTLEEFVKAVASTFNLSVQVLTSSMAQLNRTGEGATPEVKAMLGIAYEYFDQARYAAQPMVEKLRILVGTRALLRSATGQITGPRQEESDLLNAIVSMLLGTDVAVASNDVATAMSQAMPLIEATREQLKTTLLSSEIESEVLSIFDTAVNDLLRYTRPITTALHQFEKTSRVKKTFVNDLGVSLIGVGMLNFKKYIADVSPRVEACINEAAFEILQTSTKAGEHVALKVSKIVFGGVDNARQISQTLVGKLQTILEHKPEFDEKSYEGTWSEEGGTTYNRDDIVNAASSLLEFPVPKATKLLQASLEQLDELMAESVQELEYSLPPSAAYLHHDILKIMNHTLSDIHVTFQPVLDVLLPFLPDGSRPNRQVMIDIFTGTNGVNIDRFRTYCASIAMKIHELTHSAFRRIMEKAGTGGHEVQVQVGMILKNNEHQTRNIIEPFVEIISPIISSS